MAQLAGGVFSLVQYPCLTAWQERGQLGLVVRSMQRMSSATPQLWSGYQIATTEKTPGSLHHTFQPVRLFAMSRYLQDRPAHRI
jgi:hypothetical protein